MRYNNWKIYFTMVSDDPAGFIAGPLPYAWAQVVNIKRDPFETSIGRRSKTLLGLGGALAAPSTAYIYDWNLLPMGRPCVVRLSATSQLGGFVAPAGTDTRDGTRPHIELSRAALLGAP